jgi:hypothetical protein
VTTKCGVLKCLKDSLAAYSYPVVYKVEDSRALQKESSGSGTGSTQPREYN